MEIDRYDEHYAGCGQPSEESNNISDQDFLRMLQKHAGNIAQLLMSTPKIWGDSKRIKGNPNITVNDPLLNTRGGDIYIGQNCFFGHGCALLTGTHDPDSIGVERLKNAPAEGHDIIIEDGVWLASFVTVIGPARLGKNSVAAAGSLIIGDMEPNSIYAGHPAKLMRKIVKK